VVDSLMQCPNGILMWTRRFEEGGIDALRDIPRSGGPPKIDGATMDNILSEAGRTKTTPAKLRQKIWQETWILHHITYVGKLMCKARFSVKTATKVHASPAGNGTANSWRHRTKMRIVRLKKAGFAIATMDELFFIHNDAEGHKYWSPIGIPSSACGGTQEAYVFGAVTDGGRRIFRTATRGFNNRAWYSMSGLSTPLQKGGADTGQGIDAPLKASKEDIRQKQERRVHLPAQGLAISQRLGAMLAQGKNDLLNSEYSETFDNMRKAVSRCFRTVRFDLDIV